MNRTTNTDSSTSLAPKLTRSNLSGKVGDSEKEQHEADEGRQYDGGHLESLYGKQIHVNSYNDRMNRLELTDPLLAGSQRARHPDH